MKNYPKIFEAGKMGEVKVKNRIFMAPMTRNRADSYGIPKEMAVEYYSQRASAGLIVTEATQIDPIGKGYFNTPGIYNGDQAAMWAKIAEGVHKNDGLIFMQLWHVGRISHNSLLPEGEVPVAPSAITANAQTFTAMGFEDVSTPRELSVPEIKSLVSKYVFAAKLAMDAGLDGVELHGANGYLLNQFISTNTNHRRDEYGGNVENRARFLLEVVDALAKEIGAGRVGVRLSPIGKFNDIDDSSAGENYSYIYDELGRRNLSYLHVVEQFPGVDNTDSEIQLVNDLRERFVGNYISNGNYNPESAEQAVGKGAFAVAFGRPFISNPDLPERIKAGVALTEPDQATFYGGKEKGYTDYPKYS